MIKACIAAIIIVLFIIVLLSFGFAIFVCKPKRFSYEEAEKIERSKNFIVGYDYYKKEEYDIRSFDGYMLHGEIAYADSPSTKWAIITHGYTYNMLGSIKYAQIFHDLGYNTYIYDLRHHGKNKKTHCSMGYYESRDVVSVVKAIKDKFPNITYLGLHGESLGSASTNMAIKDLQNDVDFYVSDCGFTDLKSLMLYQSHSRFHMPKFLVTTANWINILLHRYSYFDIRPIESMKDNKIPILFIHGQDDDFIEPWMCKAFFDADKGYKEIYLCPKAGHAQSYEVDRVTYAQKVTDFLNNI